MNITCPTCKQEHALYWLRWGDNSKHLYYRCNKVPVLLNKDNPFKDPKLRSQSRQFMVEDEIVLLRARKDKTIPEFWNRKRQKQAEAKQQMKLF